MKQNWKTVIASTENMRDAICELLDEYSFLEDYYNNSDEDYMESSDCWVHVEAVKMEQAEMREKINSLEDELKTMTDKYNSLLQEYNSLKATSPNIKRKTRLVRKSVEIEDDLPF